jgi:hypothetical protein
MPTKIGGVRVIGYLRSSPCRRGARSGALTPRLDWSLCAYPHPRTRGVNVVQAHLAAATGLLLLLPEALRPILPLAVERRWHVGCSHLPMGLGREARPMTASARAASKSLFMTILLRFQWRPRCKHGYWPPMSATLGGARFTVEPTLATPRNGWRLCYRALQLFPAARAGSP